MNKGLRITVVTCGAPADWACPAVEHWHKRIASLASIKLHAARYKNTRRLTDALIGSLGKYPVALTQGGKAFSTPQWAQFIDELSLSSGCATFFVGGADGLPDELIAACRKKISLSSITLQHDVALIVLLEQLYRALSINAGLPYHRGK